MYDGHSGIENTQVNQGGSGDFHLILSSLKQANGQIALVIHATSNSLYFSGLQPREFLTEIGFTHFSGRCPFYHDNCFYKVFATVQRNNFDDGWEYHDQIDLLHAAFERFAGKIDELFRLRQQEKTGYWEKLEPAYRKRIYLDRQLKLKLMTQKYRFGLMTLNILGSVN